MELPDHFLLKDEGMASVSASASAYVSGSAYSEDSRSFSIKFPIDFYLKVKDMAQWSFQISSYQISNYLLSKR